MFRFLFKSHAYVTSKLSSNNDAAERSGATVQAFSDRYVKYALAFDFLEVLLCGLEIHRNLLWTEMEVTCITRILSRSKRRAALYSLKASLILKFSLHTLC